LRGGGLRGLLEGAARAVASIPAARQLVARLDPAVVLSVGGYAAGPVSLAARTRGVPIAILEPNSTLGLANRLLAPPSLLAYVAFPEVGRQFRPGVAMLSGVPLRRAFLRSEYQPEPDRFEILVLGGSQGARALNEIVPQAVALCKTSVPHLRVVHQ